MKKNLKYNICALALLGSCLTAQAQDPMVNGATVSPAPITSPTGITVSFQIGNMDPANAAIATPASEVTVSLQLLKPASDFDITTDITGLGAAYYTWTYNAPANTFMGVLTTTMPPTTGGMVYIGNLVSTGLSAPGNELNGLNVNIVAPAAINVNLVNDNTNAFTSSSAVLPFAMLPLQARNENLNAILEWATTNEQNTSHFGVEVSTDGSHFKEVAKVQASGNSELKHEYSYEYKMTANTTCYFRLKMVDRDETFTYSNVVNLKAVAAATDITVSPNPTKDVVTISGMNNGEHTVIVRDMNGRQLVKYNTADTEMKIDLGKYASGIYNVSIQDLEGNINNFKISKQ